MYPGTTLHPSNLFMVVCCSLVAFGVHAFILLHCPSTINATRLPKQAKHHRSIVSDSLDSFLPCCYLLHRHPTTPDPAAQKSRERELRAIKGMHARQAKVSGQQG